MDEKLILEIQSTLKSLIEGGENKENLLWDLNLQAEELLLGIDPENNLQMSDIAKKLGIDFCRRKENIDFNHNDTYYFDDDTSKLRPKIGIFSKHRNLFQGNIEEYIAIFKDIPSVSEEFAIAVGVGYHILYYNEDVTNSSITHNIHFHDMLFTNAREYFIYYFALSFMFTLNSTLQQIADYRKETDFLAEFDFITPNSPGVRVFINARISNLQHLMIWLFQNRPEEFKDLKDKYPLLFIDD